MSNQELRLLITGGGSAGHIMPNLAVIEELNNTAREKNIELNLHYICSRNQLDQEILKKHNIPYSPIFAWKIRRYFDVQNFLEFFGFFIGLIQALLLIIKFRPHVIFLKGGFVSVPVAITGFMLRKKMIAHESDTIPGLANKIAYFFVSKICTGFPLPGDKFIETGNPIRRKVTEGKKDKAYKFTNFSDDKKTILITGGSQGALFINQQIEKILPDLVQNYQVIHVTGKGKSVHFDHENYKQYEFLGDELFDLYQIADGAVTRGGANSLTELAANHIPMIIIPHPASNNHQEKNAEYYVKEGVAVMMRQEDGMSERLGEKIEEMTGREVEFKAQKRGSGRRIAEMIWGLTTK